MGERLILRIFKGPSEADFCAAVEDVASALGAKLAWGKSPSCFDSDFRTSHNGAVHGVYLPFVDGADFLFCMKLGESLNVPWVEVRIQEGSLWDYSLFLAGDHLDNFSTFPEYWDEEDADESWVAEQRGDPQLFSNTWAIDQASIERYYKPWHPNCPRGKAYPNDQHQYGDIWQMHDFVGALGAYDPSNTREKARQHELELPSAEAFKS